MTEYEYTNQCVEESNVDIRKAIGFRLGVLAIVLLAFALASEMWVQFALGFLFYHVGKSAWNWMRVLF